MSKPIAAVLGITGKQGGSVARALLQEGKYHVRGVSRDTSKGPAKELINQGIELIQGDATKEETLSKLFHGAHIAFAATNNDPNANEEIVGKLTADVAKKAGVHFLVWSTLPHCHRISNGKYDVPHFDLKANVDDHIKSIGIKHAFVAPVFFMENFETYFRPKKGEDGHYTVAFPFPTNVGLNAIDIYDDFGRSVVNVINNHHEFEGKWVPLFGDFLTTTQMGNILGEVHGVKITAIEIPRNSFGVEMGSMFSFYEEHGFGHKKEDEKLTEKILPKPTNFREWANKKTFTLA